MCLAAGKTFSAANKAIKGERYENKTNCGKSKSQIADELGISRPTLSQYLSGKIFPSLGMFARLCKILDCSSDDILGLK